MTASYSVKGDAFVPERPRVWIAALGGTDWNTSRESARSGWDLAPDGKRVAVVIPEGSAQAPQQHREWKKNYQAISTYVYAHSIPSKIGQDPFQQTNIRWIDRAFCRLHVIAEELDDLRRNGRLPLLSRSRSPRLRTESLKAARTEMLRLKASYVPLIAWTRTGARRPRLVADKRMAVN